MKDTLDTLARTQMPDTGIDWAPPVAPLDMPAQELERPAGRGSLLMRLAPFFFPVANA